MNWLFSKEFEKIVLMEISKDGEFITLVELILYKFFKGVAEKSCEFVWTLNRAAHTLVSHSSQRHHIAIVFWLWSVAHKHISST